MNKISKENVYIIVLILFIGIGFGYRKFFVVAKWEATKNNIEELNKYKDYYKRDSLIFNQYSEIERLYNLNKRDRSNYETAVGNILGKIEDKLKNANIEYNANDLIRDDEERVDKSGKYSLMYIELNFVSEEENFLDFINLLEKDDEIFDVSSMTITKNRINNNENSRFASASNSTTDDKLRVSLGLRVVKFK